MKLSQSTIEYILEATNFACTLQIEGLIFDDEGIRGYNDTEGVVLAASDDFDFEFDKLGINGLSNLKSKFGILGDLSEVKVKAISKKDKDDIIEKLHFQSGKVDFDYRCALPKSITDIPSKKLNRNPLFSFEVTTDDVEYITQGTNAMRSKNMTIQGTDEGVKFRFSDETGNILNYELDSELESHGEDDAVSLTINARKMLPIFKLAVRDEKFKVNILKNNIVFLSIGEMDIFVMPEV